MRIVLLGAPGAGKRTQTKRIVEKYGIPAVCTGELLKNAVAKESSPGVQVKAAMDAGRSVTEEVVLELIRERLLQADAQNGFVLDGFPRNILQAITLDELMIEMGQPLEMALLIDIETDALMERLVGRRTCKSCGTQYNIYTDPTAVDDVCDLCGGQLRHRADDNEETISNRLHIYDHLASPLIRHYEKQQKLKRVEGFGEIDEVFSNICGIIDQHEPPAQLASPGGVSAPTSLEATDLQPVPEEDPVKQLIPTGLEKIAEDSSNNEAVRKFTGKKRTSDKSDPSSSKGVRRKKAKPTAKTSSAKKTVSRQSTGVKKSQIKTKIAKKLQKPAAKKKSVKKKTVGQKAAASNRKPVTKKKVVVKKPSAAKKTMAKRKTSKQRPAGKKRPRRRPRER